MPTSQITQTRRELASLDGFFYALTETLTVDFLNPASHVWCDVGRESSES